MLTTPASDEAIAHLRRAPAHVVILPVVPKPEDRQRVLDYCNALKAELAAQTYASGRVRVVLDDRDIRGGEKAWQWVKKRVP